MITSSLMASHFLDRINANAGMMLLRSLWEYCPEHMFIVRVEGPGEYIVEAVNPTRLATLRDDAACIGERIEKVLPTPTCSRITAYFTRCVETRAPLRYEEEGESLDPDGSQRQGLWQTLLIPLTGSSGQVTHLFGISKEATQASLKEDEALERRVIERTAELMAANQKLKHLATHDHLTDTFNRRHFMELAEVELRRAYRYNLSLCLMMLDIDNFKGINDERGHPAGDQALSDVSRSIRTSVRESDLVGRYGGDEFLILMPETQADGAREIAERLRNTLRRSSGLTISIGIASLRPGDKFVDDLIRRADQLMFQAKRNGRNRIEIMA